jgi:hypothetical protein
MGSDDVLRSIVLAMAETPADGGSSASPAPNLRQMIARRRLGVVADVRL